MDSKHPSLKFLWSVISGYYTALTRPQTSCFWLFLILLVCSIGLQGEEHPYQSTGHKPTAIPIVNFSSDDGAGYGARAYLFDYDGSSIPYRRKYSIQAFFTTEGKWVHRALVDAPQLVKGYRVEIEVVLEKQDNANYFGARSDAEVDRLLKEEIIRTQGSETLVDSLLEQELIRNRGRETFRQLVPGLRLLAIRDLAGSWRWRGGLEMNHNTIKPNPAGILLARDTKMDQVVGASGGLLIQCRTALQYDSRDNYNNSTAGVLEELLLEYGLGGGGDFNGGRISYEHRHFRSLARGVVLAHRANADMTLGAVPFYKVLKLGGSSTIRGLAAARVRGRGRFLLNGELRWRGIPLWRNQHLYTGLLLFADVGQIYERDDGPSLDGWHHGRGIGLRILWQSTLVRADLGKSGGRKGVYVTFDQVF